MKFKNTILSFKLNPVTEIELPKDAKFLKIAEYEKEFFIWFQVNNENQKEKRHFVSYVENEEIIDENISYLDSVLNTKNSEFYHIYEKQY